MVGSEDFWNISGSMSAEVGGLFCSVKNDGKIVVHCVTTGYSMGSCNNRASLPLLGRFTHMHLSRVGHLALGSTLGIPDSFSFFFLLTG